MAINLASKYSSVVDERFARESLSNYGFNTDYEWVGVDTVNVYSIDTVEMNDYVRSGANRYGTPEELEDSLQTLTLSQDRAFTFTIDKGNDQEQLNIKGAGEALARQLRERTIPEIDIYRFATIAANAGHLDDVAITPSNAYSKFLEAQQALTDALVPEGGRIASVSSTYYRLLQLSGFITDSDAGQALRIIGAVGKVDNVPIVRVPTQYLPEGANFLLWHPRAACAPVTIAEFKIHVDPPGLNGNLCEGRVRHDAFVLESKAASIFYSYED